MIEEIFFLVSAYVVLIFILQVSYIQIVSKYSIFFFKVWLLFLYHNVLISYRSVSLGVEGLKWHLILLCWLCE